MSGIHFALLRHLDSLESQRANGSIVLHLIHLCRELIRRVQSVPPTIPTPRDYVMWRGRQTLSRSAVDDGVEAIEWTADHRGLAGLADLRGMPWQMEMSEFFEAWVETGVLN